MSGKYVLLRLIDTLNNHSKEYEMVQVNANQFEARYGRIGATKQTKTYSMSVWDKVYREKVGKGYQDVTSSIPTPVFQKSESTVPLAPKIEKIKVDDELLTLANSISECVVEDINEDAIRECKGLVKAMASNGTDLGHFITYYNKLRTYLPKKDKENTMKRSCFQKLFL